MANPSWEEKRNRYRVPVRNRFTSGKRLFLHVARGKNEKQAGAEKRAIAIQNKVDELDQSNDAGSAYSPSLRKWIDALKVSQRRTLIKAGQLSQAEMPEERAKAKAAATEKNITFVQWFGQWDDDHPCASENSQKVRERAERFIRLYFQDNPLAELTEYDAECFGQWLRQQPGKYKDSTLAESTARKMMQIAKTAAKGAVKKRLIALNPFDDERTTPPEKSAERKYYVTEVDCRKLLKALPTTEWKAVAILARYGGMRLPSELQQLTWDDIDWKNNLMTIRSPKLARKKNFVRQCPLFPQVKAILTKLWAEHGGEMVFPTLHRWSNINPKLRYYMTQARLQPWPDTIRELRRSCIMDACRNPRFTERNLTDWFGNTPEVRQRHYDDTTLDDVAAAAEGDGSDLRWISGESDEKGAHFGAHSPTETTGSEESAHKETRENTSDFRGLSMASECGSGPNWT